MESSTTNWLAGPKLVKNAEKRSTLVTACACTADVNLPPLIRSTDYNLVDQKRYNLSVQRSIWTDLQHLGEEFQDKPHGAVVPPIFQTSLFVFPNVEAYRNAQSSIPNEGHVYSRISNPTVNLTELKIARIEGAEAAMLTSSGMGAIASSILYGLRISGGRRKVVCVDTCYGPTREFLSSYLCNFNATVQFVGGRCKEEWLEALTEDVGVVSLESPSSVLFWHQDLEWLGKICRERNILTTLDSTYNAGILMRPLEWGIDLVTHSVTKYYSGHSDVVAGVICGKQDHIQNIKANEAQFLGLLMPPHPAWLVNRGIRTLPMRLQRVQQTANTVAAWLLEHPAIDRVFHVGMTEDADQKRIYHNQMKGSGGLLSFALKDQTQSALDAFINRLTLFQIGVSWGGHESLVTPHLAHQGLPKETYLARIYCGFEEADDLIQDLDQALAKA